MSQHHAIRCTILVMLTAKAWPVAGVDGPLVILVALLWPCWCFEKLKPGNDALKVMRNPPEDFDFPYFHMNFPMGFLGCDLQRASALPRRGCHGSSKDSLAMPLELLAIGCLNHGGCIIRVGTGDSSDTCGYQKIDMQAIGFWGSTCSETRPCTFSDTSRRSILSSSPKQVQMNGSR